MTNPTTEHTNFHLKAGWALVTGASSGLGLEWAKQLAREGYGIILSARRLEPMEKLAAQITATTGQPVVTYVADLGQGGPEVTSQLFNQAASHGPITCLVNNAGRGDFQRFDTTPLSQHQATMQLNVQSLVELSFLAVKHMQQHKHPSRIINVASIAAYLAPDNYAVYAASKAFVKSFSQTLHHELQDSNIVVTCVSPGGTRTEFMTHAQQELTTTAEKSLMTAEEVVSKGLNAARKGKAQIVTGCMNRIFILIPRILTEKAAQRWFSYAFNKLTRTTTAL